MPAWPRYRLFRFTDDRGHALESTRARKGPASKRPTGGQPVGDLQRRGPSHPRRRRRRKRPRREALSEPRVDAASEWRPAMTGAVQLGLDPAPRATWPRASGRTPEGVKLKLGRDAQKRFRPDGLPKDLERCRASASALVARTTRSASRTASSFVAPSTPSSARGSRRLGAASREPSTTA